MSIVEATIPAAATVETVDDDAVCDYCGLDDDGPTFEMIDAGEVRRLHRSCAGELARIRSERMSGQLDRLEALVTGLERLARL